MNLSPSYVATPIPPDLANLIRHEAGRRGLDPPEGRSLLPLPHPLDYEWRFTPDASRALLDLAVMLTPSEGDVLLFGTPGLAMEALSLPINRRLFFLAEDNVVTQRLIRLNQATGSPLSIAFCSGGLPRESADTVLVDPPWYMDFIRPMLAAAATACRPRGVVLMSMLPPATRPSAEDNRLATVRFAARLGLDLVDHQPLTIGYDTPFFEANALAAAGVHAPPRWRRGDLMVLRKTRSPVRPPTSTSGRRWDWGEATIGRMRLFIRSRPAPSKRIDGLIPLVEGDVLPSVSRRDIRRRSAQVWTSGNRIYRTDNPTLVLKAALLLGGEEIEAGAQSRLWHNLREHEALERVGQQLRALSTLEAGEEQGSPMSGQNGGGVACRVRRTLTAG